MANTALILFAHGSRDARWVEPFSRVRQQVMRQMPDASVDLAFLELMTPDLPTAVGQAVAQGARAVVVVPLFLGQGGHVRRDVPALIDGLRTAHPGISIRCTPAAGEDDGVLAALAAYACAALRPA